MNIGILSLPLHPGGAQRLVLEEARYLENEGHSVTIYTTESGDEEFRKGLGVSDPTIRTSPDESGGKIPLAGSLYRSQWLRSRLAKDEIEFVISHYQDVKAYLVTRGLDIEYECHINGSPFWFSENSALVPHKRKPAYDERINDFPGHANFADPKNIHTIGRVYYEFWERLRTRALRQSRRVTTITKQVSDELSFCYDIEPEVIRPGVDERWFNNIKDASPRDINGVSTDHVILNVGRLDPRKRNALLIRAFAQMRDQYQGENDTTLVIGGTGDEGDKLKKLVSELGVEDRVVFPGYIPESELPTYYAAADVLAHPAWVAYGLVPLEAYVFGTKVAMSTDTMVREIIENEKGVEVLAPDVATWADGLTRILNSDNNISNTLAVPTWREYCEMKYRNFTQ